MAEVDTSSYLKPAALPVQKSVLDQVQQYQAIDSGKLTIDRQKLDNTNQALGYMTRAMGSLGPNATKEEYLAVGQNAVKMGLVPPQMLQTYEERLQKAPTAGAFYNEFVTSAAEHQKQLDYHLGQPGTMDTGNAVQPVRTSQQPGFGIRSAGLPIAKQQGPDTPEYDENNQPRYRGVKPAVTAPGMATAPPALPVTRPAGAPATVPVGPITDPAIAGPSKNFGGNVVSANAEPPTFTNRFEPATGPQGGKSGPSPLFEEGKKQLVADQNIATEKMTAVKPALLALKLLPGLQSGPGTEQWNKAVAFLKAQNVINTDQENDKTVVYQEANKYLSQYLKGRGGRSDADLAAAEKSSPNVGVQLNPALQNLTRSAIAQDRVEAARPNAFQGTKYEDYGKHRSTFPQSVDERAFVLDLMPEAERTKLVDKMHQTYKKNPKDAEAIKFFNSLDIAKKQGFFNNQGE